MPQLTLPTSFVDGQKQAILIYNKNIVTALPYSNNQIIEDLLREIIDLHMNNESIDSVTHGGAIESFMTMLDSIVKSFDGMSVEFDERSSVACIWTLLSQIIYKNDFLMEDYSTMLRDILGKLI